MNNHMILYHGSQQIVANPQYGVGKPYNDYGVSDKGFFSYFKLAGDSFEKQIV